MKVPEVKIIDPEEIEKRAAKSREVQKDMLKKKDVDPEAMLKTFDGGYAYFQLLEAFGVNEQLVNSSTSKKEGSIGSGSIGGYYHPPIWTRYGRLVHYAEEQIKRGPCDLY